MRTAILLAALLFARRHDRRANLMLALLLTAYAATMTVVGLGSDADLREVFLRFPHLAGTIAPLPFLFGPLHYAYVRLMVEPERPFRFWLVHLAPFMACIVTLIPFYDRSG